VSRPLEDIVVENGDVKARSSLELELTADERRAIDLVEELASLLGRVVAHGTTRERDLATLHDKLRDIACRDVTGSRPSPPGPILTAR
jgi:hypothetical protein